MLLSIKDSQNLERKKHNTWRSQRMEYLKIKTDVLIIGGGGAGLRAAVAAADCGADKHLP